MHNAESVGLLAAIISLGIEVIASVWRYVVLKLPAGEASGVKTVAITGSNKLPGYVVVWMITLSLACTTVAIILRAVETGHGPFSNMYEFSVSFAWGIMAVGLYFWWRYRLYVLITIGSLIALGLLIFASTLPSQSLTLVPALQQSLLLTVHVASAVIAYGAFTISFAAAITYLLRNNPQDGENKESISLDKVSYHAVTVGFLFMTLVIILGALWADIAWGSYWSWDPKETASLVTWLLFASYLHARVMRGWRGKKAAVLIVIGFLAVIFTFFGNYIFTGLHSYR